MHVVAVASGDAGGFYCCCNTVSKELGPISSMQAEVILDHYNNY